jgi:hypothetical protein
LKDGNILEAPAIPNRNRQQISELKAVGSGSDLSLWAYFSRFTIPETNSQGPLLQHGRVEDAVLKAAALHASLKKNAGVTR